MYELKDTKQVELSDRVRFRCMRCAECCKHVENTVAIEVKDAFCLAKHLGISVMDFYNKYTNMLTLENTGFPLFFLKTKDKDNRCIFLNGKNALFMMQNLGPADYTHFGFLLMRRAKL